MDDLLVQKNTTTRAQLAVCQMNNVTEPVVGFEKIRAGLQNSNNSYLLNLPPFF